MESEHDANLVFDQDSDYEPNPGVLDQFSQFLVMHIHKFINKVFIVNYKII
jgi:hypothetical protein